MVVEIAALISVVLLEDPELRKKKLNAEVAGSGLNIVVGLETLFSRYVYIYIYMHRERERER